MRQVHSFIPHPLARPKGIGRSSSQSVSPPASPSGKPKPSLASGSASASTTAPSAVEFTVASAAKRPVLEINSQESAIAILSDARSAPASPAPAPQPLDANALRAKIDLGSEFAEKLGYWVAAPPPLINVTRRPSITERSPSARRPSVPDRVAGGALGLVPITLLLPPSTPPAAANPAPTAASPKC